MADLKDGLVKTETLWAGQVAAFKTPVEERR